TAARDDEDDDVRHLELTKSNIGPTGYGRKLRIVEVPLQIEGELVSVAKLVDEGRSGKSVMELLAARHKPGPEPEKRELARAALVEILTAAEGEAVEAGKTKKRIARETGVSEQTVWRAFKELSDEGLAAAAPVKDEYGSIVVWTWSAKTALLVSRGEG